MPIKSEHAKTPLPACAQKQSGNALQFFSLSGWCLGVMQAHSWLVALFPVQAQEETYGAHPDTLIAAVLAPRGTAKRVADGFRLSGFWPFGSGCQHADWLILGATVQDYESQTEDEGECLVPTGDIKIQDDWYVAGLSGTGSCSLVGQDVFVPAHRMLSLRRAIAGDYPGVHIHDGTLYRSAIVPVLALALSGPALGMAKAALDDFGARLPGRVVAVHGPRDTAGDAHYTSSGCGSRHENRSRASACCTAARTSSSGLQSAMCRWSFSHGSRCTWRVRMRSDSAWRPWRRCTWHAVVRESWQPIPSSVPRVTCMP